jgi:hypothetical protein
VGESASLGFIFISLNSKKSIGAKYPTRIEL